MAILDSTAQDKNAMPVTDSVRYEANRVAELYAYLQLNGVASTTVATTPGVTIATTASKVKTTNATVLRNSGAMNALAASDDFWTLTGGVLAVSKFRRYLLCASAADAASIIVSDDAATAAACVFPNLPANGIAIVGVLTVATDASTTFTAGTTLLSAAGITDTYIDGIDADVLRSFSRRLDP